MYLATCTLGLEEPLADELRELGAQDVRVERARVRFNGSTKTAYTVVLWSRIATRVQEILVQGEVKSQDDWTDLAASVDWSRSLRIDDSLAVSASVKNSVMNHSGYAGQLVKDAVVDQLRRGSERPSVDRRDADCPIIAVLHGKRGEISRSLSGDSLHRRGWRPHNHKSPLNEALAAGLLRLTGWDGKAPLCDPMCGSGTFLIEAAHWSMNRAPGLERDFAFERWPDLDASTWDALHKEARQAMKKEPAGPIFGADAHPGAIRLAEEAMKSARVDRFIRIEHKPLDSYTPPETPRLAVANPPYGKRLGEGEELEGSWSDLGNWAKNQVSGGELYVLSGNKDLTRHLRMRAEQRHPVANGSIDCRWIRYTIRERTRS